MTDATIDRISLWMAAASACGYIVVMAPRAESSGVVRSMKEKSPHQFPNLAIVAQTESSSISLATPGSDLPCLLHPWRYFEPFVIRPMMLAHVLPYAGVVRGFASAMVKSC